jgi:hypothetical protein
MHTKVPRGERKGSAGERATHPLSKRADSKSTTLLAIVPSLSRGNSPGNTERDSGNSNQHLLSFHGKLRMSLWYRDSAASRNVKP